MEFVQGLFTNVDVVAINKVGVEVDSNALKEKKTSKVIYALRLFNSLVLKDFFDPCQYNKDVEKEANLELDCDKMIQAIHDSRT